MRLDPLTPAIWRHGIALVIAFDAIQLAIRTWLRAGLEASALPVLPAFRSVALSAPSLSALALASVIAAFFFARGRAQIAAGLLALAANRALLEAFGALDGIYDESSYHAAAALLGWLAGRAFGRAVGEHRDGGELDRLSALGAAAMFGAAYLNAGTSKLLASGFSWADGDTIRLVVLSHRHAGASSPLDALRDLVGQSYAVVRALSTGTLVIQCGAFVFPWTSRTRLVWGSLFIAFHVGIRLVAESIFFGQAVALAALFAIPWATLLERMGRRPAAPAEAPEPPPPGLVLRAGMVAALALTGLLALALSPIHPRLHPIERLLVRPSASPSPSAPMPSFPTAALGPLTTGMDVADGWILRSIAIVSANRASLVLERSGQSITFDLTDVYDAPKRRFDTGNLRIEEQPTALEPQALTAPGDALARLLYAAAPGPNVAGPFRAWIREAPRP